MTDSAVAAAAIAPATAPRLRVVHSGDEQLQKLGACRDPPRSLHQGSVGSEHVERSAPIVQRLALGEALGVCAAEASPPQTGGEGFLLGVLDISARCSLETVRAEEKPMPRVRHAVSAVVTSGAQPY